jgi:hypothetical protein
MIVPRSIRIDLAPEVGEVHGRRGIGHRTILSRKADSFRSLAGLCQAKNPQGAILR